MSPVRSMVRAGAAALALATVACGNNPPAVGARLASPAAVVAFSGVTSKTPAQVKPYFAVASSRGDELRFIDQYDLILVVGPGLAFPVSVGTDARPVLLASASLGDGGPDVLAAVSSGHRSLQLVDTWSPQNTVATEVSLEGVLKPDAEVTGLIGIPARPATATAAATPARIVLTVSDVDLSAGVYGPQTGKLVSVEFDRASDGTGAVVARTVDPATSVKVLGFRATDLALEPDGLPAADGTRAPGTHLYVASTDPLSGTTYGVAQLDTTAAHALDWTVTPLDARGPTAAVAAGWVDDRVVDSTNYCSTETFAGAPHLEVLAALHPSGCGVDQAINCGLATLDPATGALALDPAAGVTLPLDAVPGGSTAVPAQPYRAPMPIPGLPTHVTVLNAPGTGSPPQRLLTETDGNTSNTDCPTTGTGVFPLYRLSSGSGTRYTSAMAVVTTSAGYSYEYDLARWAPTSSIRTLVDGNYRVQVTAMANYVSGATLGLWTDGEASPRLVTVSSDSTSALLAIQVWPGFTDGDVWTIAYQGALPHLQTQQGVLVTGTGGIYAGFQVDLANGKALTDPARFLAGTQVSDPALGVHVGDILEIVDASSTPVCDVPISAVLTPSAAASAAGVALPAGAVQLDPNDPGQSPASCLAQYATTTGAAWRMTVRASGLVLANNKLGYLGRPAVGGSADPADGGFVLAWSDEAALAADTSPAGQEKLALARRARRLFYPAEGPCPPRTLLYNQTSARLGCYYGYPRLADPLQPGPLIRFRVGVAAGTLTRGDALVFTTQSGFAQTFRVPLTGGSSPASVVPFDWASRNTTSDHANDPIRYLVTYLDDQIVGYAPTGTAADVYIR